MAWTALASPSVLDLEQACALGKGRSCYAAGLRYEKADGVARDAARAAAFYQKACRARYGIGCLYAGDAYAHGEGAPRDDARAASLYGRAAGLLAPECRRGDAYSCFALGMLYHTGRGVAADAARAAQLFDQACRGGNEHACAVRGAGPRAAPPVSPPSPAGPRPRP